MQAVQRTCCTIDDLFCGVNYDSLSCAEPLLYLPTACCKANTCGAKEGCCPCDDSTPLAPTGVPSLSFNACEFACTAAHLRLLCCQSCAMVLVHDGTVFESGVLTSLYSLSRSDELVSEPAGVTGVIHYIIAQYVSHRHAI